MHYLTVKEYAEIQGCTDRMVRHNIQCGELEAVEGRSSRGTKEYLIPLTVLPQAQQRKWYRAHHLELPPELRRRLPDTTPADSRTLEEMTEKEREQVNWWLRILEGWDKARSGEPSKADADARYIDYVEQTEGVKLTYSSLYRHQKARLCENWDGLVDSRGKWRSGQSSIPEEAWQVFLSFWLDQRRFSAAKCYEYTRMYLQMNGDTTPLPSISSFHRRIQSDVSEAVQILGRYGQKVYDDRCGPYIQRVYDDLNSNDWWVADNHTFDIISRDGETLHRLYLTAFMDVRSGIFTGLYITDKPCSQATLLALRDGIRKYGIPNYIYVDNGREFLTRDVGGLGHRQKASTRNEFQPPPVFERLGITMVNALPRNARAKIIERAFLNFKNGVSKLFPTYTGGNVLEKPSNLKDALRNGHIPEDSDLRQAVIDILEGYFNYQPYAGAVASDRGKLRQQVYNDHLLEQRLAGDAELNLMLMRSGRAQKVGRCGVTLRVSGKRIDYWTPEFVTEMVGKQVYYRYDPDDLRTVRVYDLNDRFLCALPARDDTIQKYGASTDDISESMAAIRTAQRYAKSQLATLVHPDISPDTAFELVMAQAAYNREHPPVTPANPKVLRLQRPDETPTIRPAVGWDMDLDTMIKNAQNRKGGVNNGNNDI